MSSLHLKKGDLQPPKVEGKLRLYSMAFCPFAERVRIVLEAKGIPHDIVNINLFDKPEWLFKINSKGLVPVLDTGSQILTESIDICDFLNKEYPNPPLYLEDEEQNERDRDVVEDFGSSLIPKYYDAAWKRKDYKDLKGYADAAMPNLKKLDAELAKRGTFFGGKEPKMIDYMIWPWFERIGVLEIVHEQKLPVEENDLPHLFKWCKTLRELEPIQKTITSIDRLYKVTLFHYPNSDHDYDAI